MSDSLDFSKLIRPFAGRRLPVILQSESAECGLACIAMVAGFHGLEVSLGGLRQKFSISLRGTTLAGLIRIAEDLSFNPRPVRVDLDALDQLAVPCILHWEFNHFVVLKGVRRDSIHIHDPAKGFRKVSLAEASKLFTGVALELTPSASFTPKRAAPRVRIRDLMGSVRGVRGAAAQVLLLALSLEIFAVAGPFFLQWIVDQAVPTADKELLVQLAIGFMLLVFLHQATNAFRAWVLMYVGAQVTLQWSANIFSHLLKLPIGFFERRHLGDIVSRFQSAGQIQRIATSAFAESILDGVMSVATLTMMFIYSPMLALISASVVTLYTVCRMLSKGSVAEAAERQATVAARQQSSMFETIKGVRAIQLFDAVGQRKASWLNLLVEQVNAELRSQVLALGHRSLSTLLFGLERVVIIALSAWLVIENKFSLGMLMAFIAYKDQFALRASSLADKLSELQVMGVHAERLADIVLTPTEAALDSAGSLSAPPCIEMKDVSFRYADVEASALSNINLTIGSSECVAITGPSGCGKTTLIKVILGLLKPTEGVVSVGMRDCLRAGDMSFRRSTAVVMQDDTLFAGSITENISFFDHAASRERVESCARMAGVHEEIVAMPMQYDTLIGDLGNTLSGGQQQRILFARALYRQPMFLVLDEATSQLDGARERVLNAVVAKLPITRIIIAHHSDAMASVDRVITMDRGRIVSDVKNQLAARAVPELHSM